MNKGLFELISHIKSKHRKHGICVFLGAGSDISSGGYLFDELKRNCLKKSGYSIQNDTTLYKLDDMFTDFFRSINQTRRAEILEDIMQNNDYPLSDSYKLLALLVKEKYIDAIVTTNFNNLFEIACKQIGAYVHHFVPGVINLGNFHRDLKPIMIKIHGDICLGEICHLTEDEINDKPYSEAFVSSLESIICNNTIIFSGYSGNDSQITKIFSNNKSKLKDVFWCAPKMPEESSSLYKVISDISTFIKADFDTLFETIAIEVLPDVLLSETEPFFIKTIFSSRMTRLKTSFYSGLEYKEKKERGFRWIRRKAPHLFIESFIMQKDNEGHNLGIICGNPGVGKSVIMAQLCDEHNDICIIPFEMRSLCGTDIIKSIVRSLGYVSKNDMIFLYKYIQWLDENKIPTLFIIDNLNFPDKEKNAANDLNMLFELIYITRRFSNVKFLLSVRVSVLKETDLLLNKLYLNNIIFQFEDKDYFYLDHFSIEELDEAIIKNKMQALYLDSQIKKILAEPVYFGALSKLNKSSNNKFISISDIYESFDNILASNIQGNRLINAKHALEKAAFYMFEKDLQTFCCEDVCLRDNDFSLLLSLNLISGTENQCSFAYNKVAESYFAKYIKRMELINKDNILNYFNKCRNSSFYNGLILYLSFYNDLADTFSLLRYTKKHESIHISAFIQDTINNIACLRSGQLLEQLKMFTLESNLFFSDYLIRSCNYMPDSDAFVLISFILSHSDKFNQYSLKSTKIFAIDRLSYGLRHNRDKFNTKSYLEKHFNALKVENPLLNFLQILWAISQIGPDNTSESQYNNIHEVLLECLSKIVHNEKEIVNEEHYREIYALLLQNANQLLFNSDDTIPEKFHSFVCDTELRNTIQNMNNNIAPSNDDFQRIKSEVDHLNGLTFLICNLAFVSALASNKCDNLLEDFFQTVENNTKVEVLDFFLSILFITEYIKNPLERKYFDKKIHQIVADFPEKIFENPGINRLLKRKTVQDYIEIEFSDSFCPLAAYFYTAPARNYQEEQYTQNDHTQLTLYWNIINELEKTGQYAKMLRIIHAISQMIPIWPNEGFNALERFLKYDSDIIYKAIIKVLEENYIRYPAEAIRFINNNLSYIHSSDLEKIKTAENPLLIDRSLEQLHWVRIIYFLNKINPNIVQKSLVEICNSENLFEAISGVMHLLLNECSAVSIR